MTHTGSKRITLSKELLLHLLQKIKDEDAEALEFDADAFIEAVIERNITEGYVFSSEDLN